MTFQEIVINAWICDGCGLEALAADDGLPDGWTVEVGGDAHRCAVCALQVVA